MHPSMRMSRPLVHRPGAGDHAPLGGGLDPAAHDTDSGRCVAIDHFPFIRGDGDMGDKGPGSKSKDKKKKGAKSGDKKK